MNELKISVMVDGSPSRQRTVVTLDSLDQTIRRWWNGGQLKVGELAATLAEDGMRWPVFNGQVSIQSFVETVSRWALNAGWKPDDRNTTHTAERMRQEEAVQANRPLTGAEIREMGYRTHEQVEQILDCLPPELRDMIMSPGTRAQVHILKAADLAGMLGGVEDMLEDDAPEPEDVDDAVSDVLMQAHGFGFDHQHAQLVNDLVGSADGLACQAVDAISQAMRMQDSRRRRQLLLTAINCVAGVIVYEDNHE